VGVVADARNHGLQDPTMPGAFIPHSVTGAFDRGILVRTAGPPLALLESVRREVRPLVVLGVFAVLGLVLVALGVFSVVAYAVSRQTHEIGIRMALGAARADVLRSVVGGGLRLVGSGVGLGLLASLAATRVLSHQLFGVAPQDPITMGLVAALMSAVGFLASYLPARRATRVDPLVALRHE
jgi:putative ABC transport system permease protein